MPTVSLPAKSKRSPAVPLRRRARPTSKSSTPPTSRARGPLLPALVERVSSVLRPELARVEQLSALVRGAHATFDPRRVGNFMIARVSLWLPLPAWAVLVHEWSGRPRVVASKGLPSAMAGVARRIGARVMRRGEDWLVPNVGEALGTGPDVAAVGLALTCRNQTRAVLLGFADRPCQPPLQWDEATRGLLHLALEPMALALESAVRVQRAEALSVTDDLTQLYNTRFLALALRREVKRGLRAKRPVALLFIDLDGFKDVNDTWGHLLGSRTLVEAATVLHRASRETDIVARYGGDEFAIVLPETDAQGALIMAERLRDRLAAHRFLHGEGLAVRLTASVGIAVLPDNGSTVEGLVRAADAAMYWIKARGKNGVHIAQGSVG